MSSSSSPTWPEPGESVDALLPHGIPAEVTAHLIAFGEWELGPGDWPICRQGWQVLLDVGTAFHGTTDNLPRTDDREALGRTVNSGYQDHETRTLLVDGDRWGVTPLEVVAWRHALLASHDGYNSLQPLAVRLPHVRAIASWKAAGRRLEDLDPSSREGTWLRLGVPLEDIRLWEDAGVDPNQRGLAAFVAEQGHPRYAKRLEEIWQAAVTAGHAAGEVDSFLLGFMMLFVDATEATFRRFLDGRAPWAVTCDGAVAYFRSFLVFQDDRWNEEMAAAGQGITVTEMRIRNAWSATHELPGVTTATVDLYADAGVPPWEISMWEDRFGDPSPRLREFVLMHMARILGRDAGPGPGEHGIIGEKPATQRDMPGEHWTWNRD